MELARAISSCLCGLTGPIAPGPYSSFADEKLSATPLLSPECDPSVFAHDKVAIDVVALLFRAEKCGEDLGKELDEAVGTLGWSQVLAKRILDTLVRAVREGRERMGPAIAKAYDDAVEAADCEFHKLTREAKEHPLEIAAAVLITVIVLGILAALAPYIIELLGFGELGPEAGSFAARWQSTYEGHVPARSLFSFFQRAGMIWKP
ncbi:hypothetical protein TARUN_2236 [Trichoderma arundinaceum]|uniref:Uncharacterized protein n=1 Tax=Trichoderma arundinaceum TaxID=490622 RepID=A0A395NVF7_TRIAR|nr:hypothetical protein TARUN_2236 [Trichoderma arundinaceum]